MKNKWKLSIANTVALMIYTLWSGTISLTLEIFLLGITPRQWARARIIYVILKFALADIYCANLTDFIRKISGSNSKLWFRQAVVDAFSISVYQQSLYIPSAVIAGSELSKVLLAVEFYFFESMLLGWFYGRILDWCRLKIVGVKNGDSNKK